MRDDDVFDLAIGAVSDVELRYAHDWSRVAPAGHAVQEMTVTDGGKTTRFSFANGWLAVRDDGGVGVESVANILSVSLYPISPTAVRRATYRKLLYWENVRDSMAYFENTASRELRIILNKLQGGWSYRFNALLRLGRLVELDAFVTRPAWWQLGAREKRATTLDIVERLKIQRPPELQGKVFQVFRRAKRLYVRQESGDDGSLAIGKTITLEGILHTSASQSAWR